MNRITVSQNNIYEKLLSSKNYNFVQYLGKTEGFELYLSDEIILTSIKRVKIENYDELVMIFNSLFNKPVPFFLLLFSNFQ